MRRTIRTLFAGALALALAACGGSKDAATPFRILVPDAVVPVAPMAVIELADQLGYYRRAGVSVEFVRIQATPTAIAALRSGQGDMANVSFDAALQLVGRKQIDLKGVVSPDKALPFVIIAKDAVRSIADLKGTAFGIGRVGSVDYLQTRTVLGRLGVAPDGLRYLAVGLPAVRLQALAAGRIDATTVTAGTWAALKDKTGLHLLIDAPSFHKAAPFITKINVVSAETARTKSREVQAVVDATMAASRDFARDPKMWIEAMAKARPDVPREQLEHLAKAFTHNWSVDGGLDANEIALTTDALYATPDFKDVPRVAPSQWIDMRFIEAAERALAKRDPAK